MIYLIWRQQLKLLIEAQFESWQDWETWCDWKTYFWKGFNPEEALHRAHQAYLSELHKK